MGGLAFSTGDDALYTPRMSPTVYFKMKYRCYEHLAQLFEVVKSPIDGPNKPDYGDIDFLIYGPKFLEASSEKIIEKVELLLGAKRVIVNKDNKISAHFAVPWPTGCRDMSPHEEATQRDKGILKPEGKMTKDEFFDSEARYIQVDILVYESLHVLRWILFKHAHGDIWNIISSIIRPYGLTVDDCALWIRIPEIEAADKKRSRILLTSDPNEILKFLDLPPNLYWQGPFPDLHTMYEYVARCRMFFVKPEDPAVAAARKNSGDRLQLRAKDRRRLETRPAFRRWTGDFLPECRQQGKFMSQLCTREDILKEACEHFNVGTEYETRRREYLIERQRDHIWKDIIKGRNPRPDDHDPIALTYRGCLVKALKKVILEDSGDYGVTPPDLKDADGMFIIDKVEDFIEQNRHEIGKAAINRHMVIYAELKRREAENEEGRGEPLVYGPAGI